MEALMVARRHRGFTSKAPTKGPARRKSQYHAELWLVWHCMRPPKQKTREYSKQAAGGPSLCLREGRATIVHSKVLNATYLHVQGMKASDYSECRTRVVRVASQVADTGPASRRQDARNETADVDTVLSGSVIEKGETALRDTSVPEPGLSPSYRNSAPSKEISDSVSSITSGINELTSVRIVAASGAAAEVPCSDSFSMRADRSPLENQTESAPSTSGRVDRPVTRKWVRDATGTMRRVVQPVSSPDSPPAKVKPLSPSRMKLPRHGPPRAAAVVQVLNEARDLTTEAVLDQLADALQRQELNMIIKDLGLRGRPNKAFQVFQWMLQQGNERRVPDEISFNSMITGLSKHGQLDKAHSVFDMMEPAGCRRNVLIYNALLSGYAKRGRAFDALELFEQMKGDGIEPDDSSYNILINACGRGKQLTQALALFEEMVARGLKPSRVTYTSLVSACGRDNRPFQALRIFEEATQGGISPDCPMFNSLLGALGRGNLYTEMGVIRARMAERGCTPSLEVYTCIVASYRQGGKTAEVDEVLAEMRGAGYDPGPTRFPT